MSKWIETDLDLLDAYVGPSHRQWWQPKPKGLPKSKQVRRALRRKRYAEDPAYRERNLTLHKEWEARKAAADPEWAERRAESKCKSARRRRLAVKVVPDAP